MKQPVLERTQDETDHLTVGRPWWPAFFFLMLVLVEYHPVVWSICFKKQLWTGCNFFFLSSISIRSWRSWRSEFLFHIYENVLSIFARSPRSRSILERQKIQMKTTRHGTKMTQDTQDLSCIPNRNTLWRSDIYTSKLKTKQPNLVD